MKKIFILIATLQLIFLSSCSSESFKSHSFFAMDTFISADIQCLDDSVFEQLENSVYADEQKFSKTFASSEIYKFNHSENGVELSEETAALIEKSVEISTNTQGAFLPFMGALTDLWDIKSENPRIPSDDEILNALNNCKISDISVGKNGIKKSNPDLKVDLGAIAKGYSAEKCIEILKNNGIENAVLSFGGNVACIGNAKDKNDGWNVGIKNPFATNEIIGSIKISDCFLSVSGAYERFFEIDGVRYHHIFDLKTGYPAESDIESVAVISNDGTIADALSTALFVMGKEKSFDLYKSGIYDFEAIFVLKNGTVTATDGIRDKFVFNTSATFKNKQKLTYNNVKEK